MAVPDVIATTDVPDLAPSPTSAGASCFRDPLGCACRACEAIRRAGPAMPANPLARLLGATLDAPVAEPVQHARARMAERQRAAMRSLSARTKARQRLAAAYRLDTLEAAILARHGVRPAFA